MPDGTTGYCTLGAIAAIAVGLPEDNDATDMFYDGAWNRDEKVRDAMIALYQTAEGLKDEFTSSDIDCVPQVISEYNNERCMRYSDVKSWIGRAMEHLRTD